MAHSIDWFTRALGLTLRWRHGDYAAMNVGETAFTLHQVEEPQPVAYEPFNFYTPDIRAAHAQIKENGGEPTDIVDYGDVLTFQFKDPDGNLLGVCHFSE